MLGGVRGTDETPVLAGFWCGVGGEATGLAPASTAGDHRCGTTPDSHRTSLSVDVRRVPPLTIRHRGDPRLVLIS